MPKSFAIAVSSEVSVVRAMAGIDGRGLSMVRVLTNSVARCWASAALPPLPQMRSLPPLRSEVTRSEAADTTPYDSPATEIPAGFGRPIDDPEFPNGRNDAEWLKHTLWYSEGNRLDYKPVNLKPMTVESIPPNVRTF